MTKTKDNRTTGERIATGLAQFGRLACWYGIALVIVGLLPSVGGDVSFLGAMITIVGCALDTIATLIGDELRWKREEADSARPEEEWD